MSYLSRGLKLIWFAVCLSGNVYQISVISSNYLGYQITTTIQVNFPDISVAPALGSCFYEIQIIDWDKLLAIKPNVKRDLGVPDNFTNQDLMAMMLNQGLDGKMVLQDTIFKRLDVKTRRSVTYNSSQLFEACLLMENDGAMLQAGKCSDLFNITSYSFTYFVCHSFDFKTQNLSLGFLDSNRAETAPGLLGGIRLTELARNIVDESSIVYNYNHNVQRVGFKRYIFLSDLNQLISLTYDEYSNSLLSFPYSTKCKVYDDGDIKDRGSCFESCLENRSVSFLGKDTIFPSIHLFAKEVDSNPKLQIISVHQLFSNQTLLKFRNKVSLECDKLCSSPSCRDTFYVPQLQSSIEYKYPLILTYIMQSPMVDTRCEPKFSFVVFMTNVFSTFGFWIGLSVFSFIDHLADYLGKLLDSLASNKQRTQTMTVNKSSPNQEGRLSRVEQMRRRKLFASCYDNYLLSRNPRLTRMSPMMLKRYNLVNLVEQRD